MLHKVKSTIEDNFLFDKGEQILVGVSGGADSVALLSVLHKLAEQEGWQLHVAHVEHGLRGEESIEDARFVEKLCGEWKIPFHLMQPDVKKYAAEQGISTQVAARELRYAFFRDTAKRIGASKVALAHHADDQAETILMRVLRGTSVAGLTGIPLRRKMDGIEVVRPFLYVWRSEIEEYCQKEKIVYRNDSTNALTDYLRNKIRLQLIPQLEREYNPNLRRGLTQLGDIASHEDSYMNQQAELIFEQIVKKGLDSGWSVDKTGLLCQPLALQRRVITLILYYLSGCTIEWEAKHITSIIGLANHPSPSARIDLPFGVRAWREYDFIHIAKSPVWEIPAHRTEAALPVPTWPVDQSKMVFPFCFPEFCLNGSIELLEGAESPVDQWEAVFDYDQIQDRSFLIRSRLPGEWMRPIGMTGRKKIKEIMMEARIPLYRRNFWPLWLIDDQVVWVTGIRRSQFAVVGPQTRRTVRIRVNQQQLQEEMPTQED